jgi:hypothetical protein
MDGFKILVLAGVAILWIFVVAGIVAAILNLHIDGGMRFLLLVLVFWGYATLKQLNELGRQAEQLKYWIRLTFITVHLRNEADSLPAANDRLREDLETDNRRARTDKELSSDANWIYPTFVAVFLIVLGAMLNYQLFGDFGGEWFSRAFPAHQ